MKYYLLVAMFVPFGGSVFAQNDTLTRAFTLLEYGMVLNENYYLARNEIAQRWHIEYKRVANCMVDDRLMDSVRNHNITIHNELAKMYGEQWETDYQKQWKHLLDSLDNEAVLLTRKNELERTKRLALQPHHSNIAMEISGANVLFRGYENKIIPAVSNGNYPITLYSADCSISRPENASYFIVKPGTAKTVEVTLCKIENDSLIPLKTTSYRVVNLPDPNLYWGKSKSGGSADLQNLNLEVKYDPFFPLEGDFEIVKWDIAFTDSTYAGKDGDLSPAKALFDTLQEGTIITIRVLVREGDGISRYMNGSWNL